MVIKLQKLSPTGIDSQECSRNAGDPFLVQIALAAFLGPPLGAGSLSERSFEKTTDGVYVSFRVSHLNQKHLDGLGCLWRNQRRSLRYVLRGSSPMDRWRMFKTLKFYFGSIVEDVTATVRQHFSIS